ncbi:hypothetical protein NW763_000350 [Fusarium oxysporum]|nr:hypothetical protein NW763_000350 [Fusarium oxysporum]
MLTESVGWCEAVDDYGGVDDYSHENVPKDVLVAYSRRMGVSHIRYFAGPYQLQKDGSSVIIQIDELVEEMEHDLPEAAGALSLAPSQSTIAGVLCRPTHRRPALMRNSMP